ncbi:hypothetical protein [Halobacteriovorax sp. HLS]|uniref:hypothetical protein n=1 Tax=Halobacteriovorax sp. HLS TaxID=2234000 RepID=UPI000FD7A489|nr:hypothetical protein [Halobacteriovorax sp. HLS]
MNVQLLSDKQDIINPIKLFFQRKSFQIFKTDSIESFFKNCVENPSNIFILQSDIGSETQILDFIKDLRLYFGAFPLIFVIDTKTKIQNVANFLNVGADSALYLPLDFTIIEDFIRNRLQKDSFLPIHYRHVPSGGIPVKLSRPIKLSQVSTDGITFESADFLMRGMFFKFNFENIFKLSTRQIKCKITICEKNETEETYKYFAEYFEIAPGLRKEIRFSLKNI